VANKKLSAYRSKRDFTRTAEPPGGTPVARSRRLLFVIQKHAARRPHYDLRLEVDGVFKSWAVTRGPTLRSAQSFQQRPELVLATVPVDQVIQAGSPVGFPAQHFVSEGGLLEPLHR
jgi:hypothetical protein